jgi:hypothetical protein
LKHVAPDFRREHLLTQRREAEIRGLERKANAITEIITRERMRGRHVNINCTTKKRKGGGKVFAIERVKQDGTKSVHNSQSAIDVVAGQTIAERYRLAYSAPIMSNNELLTDVGFAGDGQAVMSILQGTYTFPRGTDSYTKLLMLEASVLFSSLVEDGVEDFVHRGFPRLLDRRTREDRIKQIPSPFWPLRSSRA